MISKIFLPLEKKQQQRVFYISIILFISSIFELASFFTIIPFTQSIIDFDDFSRGKAYQFLKIFFDFEEGQTTIILGSISILMLAMSAIIYYIANSKLIFFINEIGANLSSKIYQSYMSSNFEFFLKKNSTEFSKNITIEVSRYSQNVLGPFLNLLSKSFYTISALILLLIVNPFAAIFVSLICATVYLTIFKFIGQRLSKNGEVISEYNKLRFLSLDESIKGIREVKIYGLTDEYIKMLYAYNYRISRSIASSQAIGIVPKSFVEALAFGSIISLIIILVANDLIIEVLPEIAIFIFVGYKLIPGLQQIYSSLTLIKANINSIETFPSPITLKDLKFKFNGKINTRQTPINFESLEFQNVYYTYPNNIRPTIENVNFKIKAGEKVFINGRSGSGKSTVFDIITGFLEPTSGNVLINNQPPPALDYRFLLFSYVPQFTTFRAGSFRDNIAVGDPEPDDDRVLELCDLLGLSEYIDTLSNGIYSDIGENAQNLSGGQKQRLGIARALYSNREIILLDEALSALDEENKNKVLHVIHKLYHKKTIIMITHQMDESIGCSVSINID